MARIAIASVEKTVKLGEVIGSLLPAYHIQAIFLNGVLGCGKTTLTRAIVSTLPGGKKAEISSPSFTICNYYPTYPRIVHCDLYRQRYSVPDEVYENFDNPGLISIIEWANYIDTRYRPDEFLELTFDFEGERRLLTFTAYGSKTCSLTDQLVKNFGSNNLIK